MLFYSPDLARACRAGAAGYDALYIAGTWTYPLLAAAKAAIAARIPYMISPRGSFMTWAMQKGCLKKRIYLRFVERPLIDKASEIHYTTHLEARQAASFEFGPRPVVIPNGIETSLFCDLPEKGQWRRKLHLTDADRLSIFSGRLVKDKRLPLIIRSFAVASNGLPSAYLAIAGPDYGERKAILKTVAELGLEKKVFLLGDLRWSELLELYTDADMLVMLSWRESFGMAVAEAMAAGCAVLVSEDVGLADEVRCAHAGSVVPSRTPEVAREWRTMLCDSDLKALGRNGREYALQHFNSDNVAGAVVQALCRPTEAPSRSVVRATIGGDGGAS